MLRGQRWDMPGRHLIRNYARRERMKDMWAWLWNWGISTAAYMALKTINCP